MNVNFVTSAFVNPNATPQFRGLEDNIRLANLDPEIKKRYDGIIKEHLEPVVTSIGTTGWEIVLYIDKQLRESPNARAWGKDFLGLSTILDLFNAQSDKDKVSDFLWNCPIITGDMEGSRNWIRLKTDEFWNNPDLMLYLRSKAPQKYSD